MDHPDELPFARLPLQTVLTIGNSTSRSLTHLKERIVTRGYVFTASEQAPGRYGILQSPAGTLPPDNAVPPTVEGVPPLLLVQQHSSLAPNPDPWHVLGWKAVAFLRRKPGGQAELGAEEFDTIVLSEHFFYLILRDYNIHAPAAERPYHLRAALLRACQKLAPIDPRVALDIFHRAAKLQGIEPHPPYLIDKIRHLQRQFPHDVTIARTLLRAYGTNARRYASGAAAVERLRRAGTETDRLLLGLYGYDPTVPRAAIREAAYQHPTMFLIPKAQQLISAGDFQAAKHLGHTVWSSHRDSTVRAVAARIARDAAWYAGELDASHTYGRAVLEETRARWGRDWLMFRRDLDHVTETAAHISDDVAQLINTFPYNAPGDIAAMARSSIEFAAATGGEQAALAAAHKQPSSPQSITRLHYLHLAEQAAQHTGQFTHAYRAALRSLPPGIAEWFELPERDQRERFLTPHRKSLGSHIMSLHVGARLYQIGDRRSLRLHIASAEPHLRHTRRLTALLSGAFNEGTLAMFDTWFTGRSVLRITLFGQPTAYLGRHALTLSNEELELLALLALHPKGILEMDIARLLFPGETARATVRTLALRLREKVEIGNAPYRLEVPVVTDYQAFLNAYALHDDEEVLRNYINPIFPSSNAPFIVALRDEVQGMVRTAAQRVTNVALLIERYVDFIGEEWYREHLASLLTPNDPRWPLIWATEQHLFSGPQAAKPEEHT